MKLFPTIILAACLFGLAPPTQAAEAAPLARAALAADRLEIMELGAHFDNGLDSEDQGKFVGVFIPTGVLAGFWGEAKGPEQIASAFRYMLATFSKNRRHVVTNQEIAVEGDRATMYSYLTVFDRTKTAITGTATFRDELVRTPDGWRFARRTLTADPNVQPIIDGLRRQGAQ